MLVLQINERKKETVSSYRKEEGVLNLFRARQVPRALRRPGHLRSPFHKLRQGPLDARGVQSVEPLGDLFPAVVAGVRGGRDVFSFSDQE